ncbi:MAG: MT-A70 family methyltransferase [Nostoc sp. DedQUE08]|uniref:MT-A70 family methyltransferase n=1 Tax=Nostoc sp. DedQUE08 TaxID=3075393 RepID=UPI002AD4063F|nr:MT-A70 family methyltransferase [Nostoc sp. DedQUE08]MDZ8069938.1 MT-A70 family methyltransferase [Nostoc sp. DedQUE08]
MRLTTLEGQYQCIVIDPPWFYRLRNQDKTHRNRINYKPMHIQEILSLPVPDLSDRTGSVLWLWYTNNHMIEAAHCLETWGFELKTILTWEKVTKDNTKTHLEDRFSIQGYDEKFGFLLGARRKLCLK